VFRAHRKRRAASEVLLVATVALILLSAVLPAAGQSDSSQPKAPQTAKDHYVLAEYYNSQAAELRGEIEKHKQMLAEYSKGVARNSKDVVENPYIKKMRLHCEKYIKAAESLEAEALEFARFHTLRAKELEGK
jgi:hypothetical protein